jgi:hypothetical protein
MYLDDAITTINRFDHAVAWMYLDTDGCVCVGNHYRLDNALAASKLPFSRWTAAEATPSEIAREFERVQQMRIGFIPNAYRRSDSLLLSKAAMQKLLHSTLIDCTSKLLALFPHFFGFPDVVKIALLDMSYDVGVEELPASLRKAVARENWSLASTLCARSYASKERNHWTQNQFQNAPVAV